MAPLEVCTLGNVMVQVQPVMPCALTMGFFRSNHQALFFESDGALGSQCLGNGVFEV